MNGYSSKRKRGKRCKKPLKQKATVIPNNSPPPWSPEYLSPNKEVDAFVAYVGLREVEIKARRDSIADLELAVRKKWSGASLQVFGSFKEGLGHIYSSDVDVEILEVPGFLHSDSETPSSVANPQLSGAVSTGAHSSIEPVCARETDEDARALSKSKISAACESSHGIELHIVARKASFLLDTNERKSVEVLKQRRCEDRASHDSKSKVLSKLTDTLRKLPWCKELNFLNKARIPIVSFRHQNHTCLDVTVGLNRRSAALNEAGAVSLSKLGLSNTLMTSITLILKVLLAQRDLNKVHQGGLGSYRVYIIVASFLETIHSSVHSGNGKERVGAADALKRFFRWASTHGNLTQRTTLSVKGHVVDLAAVTKLPEIVVLFGWVSGIFSASPSGVPGELPISWLGQVIDGRRLRDERESSFETTAHSIESPPTRKKTVEAAVASRMKKRRVDIDVAPLKRGPRQQQQLR